METKIQSIPPEMFGGWIDKTLPRLDPETSPNSLLPKRQRKECGKRALQHFSNDFGRSAGEFEMFLASYQFQHFKRSRYASAYSFGFFILFIIYLFSALLQILLIHKSACR